MKKYLAALLIFFMAGIALPQKAHAAVDFIKPTSSFYFFQSWKESLGLFFSFSKESKLEYLEDLNNERIRDMQDFGSNDAQVAEMLAKKYENNYRKIEKLALKIQDKSQIAEKIENNSLAQQETLARVYGQVPDQAKSAILNAQVNSSKNVSAVLEKSSPEKAMAYAQKVQQIQIAQIMRKVEKAEKESGNEGGSPEGRGPKPLNTINEGNELNQINSTYNINSTDGSNSTSGQDSAGKIQPMQPAPMQAPAGQN